MARPAGIKPLARSKKVNMLLYSDPGIGKTKLIGTTPGKCLILRPPVDHTDSIRNPGPGLEEWVLETWNEAWEALEYVRHDGGDWDWVWLDSGSLFQDIGLDDIWDTVIHEKPARARYGLDKQEYGINMFRLGQWVRHMVGAGIVNFGMTAHSMPLPSSLDPESEVVLMPMITGKTSGIPGGMAIKMCGYMNVVARLALGKSKKDTKPRVLYTQATDDYYAKDQFDAIPGGKLVNPTMPRVLELIEAARPKSGGAKKRRGSTPTRRRTRRKGSKA